MSEKQLHEQAFKSRFGAGFAMRSCGMEARSESQPRTNVNLQAGWLSWVSVRGYVMPDFRSGTGSSEGGSGETFLNLTPRDLSGSDWFGRTKGGNDQGPMPVEKSDHLIVASKPSNAGGAKGMTN